MLKRRISSYISKDLEKKMVFIAGPRQCGKTTLARSLNPTESQEYYNWDFGENRKKLLQYILNPDVLLWIFDEIHKYKSWKNWLKGVYDKFHDQKKILVTGSAKLDLYSRGGDSLQGRYFLYRLHPVTLSELVGNEFSEDFSWFQDFSHTQKIQEALIQLLQRGGFPEPLLSFSQRDTDRWRMNYSSRLIQEDIRDLESVSDLGKMELLYEHCPELVGSPLSINHLRTHLEVAHKTLERWITIFEKTYSVFRIPPLEGKVIKAIKKEQKLYLWDWSRVTDEGARFENCIAVHLLRWCHFMEDVYGKKAELRYFRTRMGHEVDFVVTLDHKPYAAIEVKLKQKPIDKNMFYFLEHFEVPYAFQVSLYGEDNYITQKEGKTAIHSMPGWRFLQNLP